MCLCVCVCVDIFIYIYVIPILEKKGALVKMILKIFT